MAELKTKPTDANVSEFLNAIADDQKRADALTLCALFEKVIGVPPKMWGPAIVGFGQYHYKYESGQEGDWFIAGFSPRKANFSLYIMPCMDAGYADFLSRLGKHKTGKSCLYLTKLQQIDLDVLQEMLRHCVNRHNDGLVLPNNC